MPIWLNLAQWFGEDFINFVNVFSVFCNYLPMEKGGNPSLEQITQEHFVPHLVEIGQMALEKKISKYR